MDLCVCVCVCLCYQRNLMHSNFSINFWMTLIPQPAKTCTNMTINKSQNMSHKICKFLIEILFIWEIISINFAHCVQCSLSVLHSAQCTAFFFRRFGFVYFISYFFVSLIFHSSHYNPRGNCISKNKPYAVCFEFSSPCRSFNEFHYN